MGTRNLTMVILGGAVVVAQYGQWDGMSSGQGQTILDFLNGKKDWVMVRNYNDEAKNTILNLPEGPFDMEHFKAQLAKCRFGTDAEIEAIHKDYTTGDGMMTMDQAEAFKASKYGYLSRDTGAKILPLIYGMADDELILSDMSGFANESLFCEYAYVIDIDQEQLEVYTGFRTSPPSDQQRFSGPETAQPADWKPSYSGDNWYFPVQLAYMISFADLEGMTALPEISDDDEELHQEMDAAQGEA